VANLFDLRFGLFAFCPLLMFGLPGVWLASDAWFSRAEKWLLAAAAFAFLLFCSANQFARMQWNTGVRYLVPLVPFLMLGVVVVLERLSARARYAIATMAFSQAWVMAMVRESVPESFGTVLAHGPQLPWLTVLGRMAPQYLPGLGGPPPAWPLILIAAAMLYVLWSRTLDPQHPAIRILEPIS
jgi:hypothetical protein